MDTSAPIYTIYGQRKCRYEGEYAPELLDACDEATMEENPEWYEERLKHHRESGEFEDVVRIQFAVYWPAIKAAFQTIVVGAKQEEEAANQARRVHLRAEMQTLLRLLDDIRIGQPINSETIEQGIKKVQRELDETK